MMMISAIWNTNGFRPNFQNVVLRDSSITGLALDCSNFGQENLEAENWEWWDMDFSCFFGV
jgi:hypothetical protein